MKIYKYELQPQSERYASNAANNYKIRRKALGSNDFDNLQILVSNTDDDAPLVARKIVEVLNNVGEITLIDGFPVEPKARSNSDLITAKQIGFINALARDTHSDALEICRKLMSCDISELSKKAASSLIYHLQQIEARQVAEAARRL